MNSALWQSLSTAKWNLGIAPCFFHFILCFSFYYYFIFPPRGDGTHTNSYRRHKWTWISESKPLHFDISADRCKNIHRKQSNNKRFMYVGRKGNAKPMPGAVRFTFLLRHSPCQHTVKPNMAGSSLTYTHASWALVRQTDVWAPTNCWMFVCVCKKWVNKLQYFPLNLMYNASWQLIQFTADSRPSVTCHVLSAQINELV